MISLSKNLLPLLCMAFCITSLSSSCVLPIQTTRAKNKALKAIATAEKKQAFVRGCYNYYRAKLYIEKGQEEEGYSDFEPAKRYLNQAVVFSKKSEEKHLVTANKSPVVTCLSHPQMKAKYQEKNGFPYVSSVQKEEGNSQKTQKKTSTLDSTKKDKPSVKELPKSKKSNSSKESTQK